MSPEPIPASPNGAPAIVHSVRSLDSRLIFEGASLVEIIHAGQRYILRITRENRLILTK